MSRVCHQQQSRYSSRRLVSVHIHHKTHSDSTQPVYLLCCFETTYMLALLAPLQLIADFHKNNGSAFDLRPTRFEAEESPGTQEGGLQAQYFSPNLFKKKVVAMSLHARFEYSGWRRHKLLGNPNFVYCSRHKILNNK